VFLKFLFFLIILILGHPEFSLFSRNLAKLGDYQNSTSDLATGTPPGAGIFFTSELLLESSSRFPNFARQNRSLRRGNGCPKNHWKCFIGNPLTFPALFLWKMCRFVQRPDHFWKSQISGNDHFTNASTKSGKVMFWRTSPYFEKWRISLGQSAHDPSSRFLLLTHLRRLAFRLGVLSHETREPSSILHLSYWVRPATQAGHDSFKSVYSQIYKDNKQVIWKWI
jgi:hypothetical protein